MAKVLKKAAKACGKVLLAVVIILAFLCVITLIWGFVQQNRGSIMDLPQTPKNFTPGVRMVLFTDSHNENERVADAMDTAYRLFDKDSSYTGVDAFVGLGDFSSVGGEDDYIAYARTLREHVKEPTLLINILGNHEMKQKEKCETYFSTALAQEPNVSGTINGFPYVAFSGEASLTEWTFTPSSLHWFANAVEQAEQQADGKPVFVFQHPHPWGTVYGSSVWGNPQVNVILNGHTSVVDFSGHSHYPMSDARSINQTTYTAVGCGSMSRFELDKDGIVNQHPPGYDSAAQMCVVEADADGSVRIRGYDLNSDCYFCDYYIDNVNQKESFPYTYKNLKAHDSAPVFSEKTAATAERDEQGEWVLSFDKAKAAPGFAVHEYKIVVRDARNKTVWKGNCISDYFIFNEDDKAHFAIGKNTLESGKEYHLELIAESIYHFKSEPCKLTFTAQ